MDMALLLPFGYVFLILTSVSPSIMFLFASLTSSVLYFKVTGKRVHSFITFYNLQILFYYTLVKCVCVYKIH